MRSRKVIAVVVGSAMTILALGAGHAGTAGADTAPQSTTTTDAAAQSTTTTDAAAQSTTTTEPAPQTTTTTRPAPGTITTAAGNVLCQARGTVSYKPPLQRAPIVTVATIKATLTCSVGETGNPAKTVTGGTLTATTSPFSAGCIDASPASLDAKITWTSRGGKVAPTRITLQGVDSGTFPFRHAFRSTSSSGSYAAEQSVLDLMSDTSATKACGTHGVASWSFPGRSRTSTLMIQPRIATLTQVLANNTLVAGKTTALRLFGAPVTLAKTQSIETTVTRPDGSVSTLTWSRGDAADIRPDSDGSSIVVRIPGNQISQTGTYRANARILDSRRVVLANYGVDDFVLLPTRDLRILVVFLTHPGFFEETQAWYDDINDSMLRIGAMFPLRDGVKQGFDSPQGAGLEYVFGTPCNGWTDEYYDCVYGQTRALNAQGKHIDLTIEYRPGLYAPEFDPPGDPHPGGNAGPPPAPYSDLERANCVAGVWNGVHVTAPACGHEIGHNFGFEASCSPHWDGGLHSEDYLVADGFAFDALRNVQYPSEVGDIMSWGWDRGRDAATPSSFDWEYMRKQMLGLPGC